MKDAIMVTATDTGVGKTVVTAALIRAMRARGFSAGGLKPFATGCAERGGVLVSDDAEIIREACEFELPREVVSPVRYAEPLAPAVAARAAGVPVDVRSALDAFANVCGRYDFVIVEGIGGLAVPVTDDMTVADFAARCGLELVVVARRTLGTLNHTALTVEYARSKGLAVRGIILAGDSGAEDDISVTSNQAELERLTGIPVVASLPPLGRGSGIDDVIGAAVAKLAPERIMKL